MSRKASSKQTNENPSQKRRKKKQEPNTVLPPFDLYTCSDYSFHEGFSSVVKILRERRNILVLVGAGVSVSCGIPDFRSKDSGLYSTLNAPELGLSCPEELFDYNVFCEDPKPFYKFAKQLYAPIMTVGNKQEKVQPSCCHKFLSLLEQHGKLLRIYTQNMDGLEEIAGVSPNKVVYAHGNLQHASCCKCHHTVNFQEIQQDVSNGIVPKCKQPKTKKKNTTNPSATILSLPKSGNTLQNGVRHNTRKQSRRPYLEEDVNYCNGVLKPNIVFFGETLDNVVGKSLELDKKKADAVLVIGTSLSVSPMSKVIQYLSPNIPRILMNRTVVSYPPNVTTTSSSNEKEQDEEDDFRNNKYMFDAYLLGFCDDVTRALVKEMFATDKNAAKACCATITSSNSPTKDHQARNGQVLATLEDEEGLYNYQEYKKLKEFCVLNNHHGSSLQRHARFQIPPERVFLFPGAILQETSQQDQGEDFQEVAHCDGCSQQIPTDIYKCCQCFDYDLCGTCYSKLRTQHANGQHVFMMETQPPKEESK